jgi:citronellol/citronellal dehydrogenase
MGEMSDRYASSFRPDLLAGQVALVTGGGTGIGRAVAHELAALGAEVALVARREEPLAATAAEIEAAGGTASAVVANIRDADEVDAAVDAVVARHGALDLLVNNAGGQFPSPAEAITPNGWRSVVDLNLTGTFLVTRAAFRAWMGEHGGAVVSVLAEMRNGFPGMAHTGAARAGVENLTRTLAVEWGARGIRVNAVAPGFVYSSGMDTYDRSFVEVAARAAARVPAGRIGTESETAAAITFLLSPAAAFITGQTLWVDGGASLAKAPLVPLEPHDRVPPFDGFHLAREVPEEWRGG